MMRKFSTRLVDARSRSLRIHRRATTLFAGGLAVAAWSSAFIGIGYALREMSPGAIVLLRFLIASSCFLFLAVVGWVKWPTWNDLLPLGMLGLLGHGIYQLALSIAQTGIPAGTASVLISTVPVFSALLAIPALGERISSRGWMGIVFAFAGVLVVNVTKSHALLFEPMALVGLVAAAASATYFVLQKPWLSRYRAIDLTAYGVWAGTLGMLVFLRDLPDALMSASWSTLLSVAYLAIVPTIVGYSLWSFALARTSVSSVTSLLYLQPAMTFFSAWLALGEVPAPSAVLGGVLALVGVALVNTSRSSTAQKNTSLEDEDTPS